MKSLNLGPDNFDRFDTILWQNNPFYCNPLFGSGKNSDIFRTLCENALTSLAEMCLQSYLTTSKVSDGRLDHRQRPWPIRSLEGAEIHSCAHDFTASDVLPRSSKPCDFCRCDCHRNQLTISQGNESFLVKIVRNSTDMDDRRRSYGNTTLLNDVYKEIEELSKCLSYSSSNENCIDMDTFNEEFKSVFKDLDSVDSFEQQHPPTEVSEHESEESFALVIPITKRRGKLKVDGLKFIDPKRLVTEHELKYEDKDFIDFLKDLSVQIDVINDVPKNNNNVNCDNNAVLMDLDSSSPSASLSLGLDSETDSDSIFGESAEKDIVENGVIIKPADLFKSPGQQCESTVASDEFVWTKLTVVPEEDETSCSDLEGHSPSERVAEVRETGDIVAWKRELWRSALDDDDEDWIYYSPSECPDQWFSSTDSEGRVYFFEENSNKSSWALPEIELLDKNEDKETISVNINTSSSSLEFDKGFNRNVKSKSMVLAPRNEEASPVLMSATHWPQLSEGTMCVLKEGPLNKTKITENGKRLRKNWTSTHAVLTELLLLFFKDNKGFPSMMSGNGRPELSVDLNGAVIDSGDKVSSRKHVYLLSTMLGLQVLIQCDCATSANQWLQAIQSAIHQLPLSVDAVCPRIKPSSPPGKPGKLQSPTEEKSSRISRSKSMKLKNKSASIEDLSGNPAERQTKIRERLKKFFNRRPTVELLVKKGIWKDEPVFGCLLEQICPAEPPRVPLFVQHCIRCIEGSEDNMRTDGLYRASGNLSQVQKIRLQVDQNIYNLLDEEEDVHVLAGTLKLFFRELKQPLIPFKFFTKALSASTKHNRNEKTRDFREIVKALPPCNHDTLKVLLQHLLNVTRYQEHNRMHIPNIAIVFGPTLMWPEQESTNMAFDLMQQNLVIESFLLEFHNIFH